MGVPEEERIDNMSYVFFQEVLEHLGKKLNYESISNLLGRTVFDKKGGESISRAVENANPLTKVSQTHSAATFLSMAGTLAIVEAGNEDAAKKTMGDISWFEEFLK